MTEGQYYILLDEIENSIIPVYKPIPVCYNTHDGFTFSKTENTISKYQLLGGCKSIYLFNEYQEFVLKLKEIIKNKYNNKLYTYQGKTPIKLEVKYGKDWHDPLDKMEICIFSQGGIYKPWHNRFGHLIRDKIYNHQGVDLFAVPGTPVYACCDAKIDKCATNITPALSGNGREIILAITGENANRLNKIIEYKIKYYETVGLLYSEEGEILYDTVTPFKRSNDTIYIRYAHLSKIADGITKGSIVKAGQQIGCSGTTGVKNGKNLWGTHAPHLHFEVLSYYPHTGLAYRINPIVLVDFKCPFVGETEESAILKFKDQNSYKNNYKYNKTFIIEGEK